MVEKPNRQDFEAWLEGKPVEWAQALAVRAAMRVLPLGVEIFAHDNLDEDDQQGLFFSAFRATLISWAARKYPAHDMRVAAVNAADASSITSSVATTATSTAAAATFSATAAIAAITTAAFSAANAASTVNAASASIAASTTVAASASSAIATAAASSADDIWQAVNGDIIFLEARPDKPALAARGLVSQWLWVDMNGKHVTPDWYKEQFPQLTDTLDALDDNWQVWTGWYNAQHRNTSPWGLPAKAAEKLVLRIVDQDDDWWHAGPGAVNAEIAAWLAEFRESAMLDEARAKLAGLIALRGNVSLENEITFATPELPWLSDGVDPNVDHLARSGIGFALAVRINEIWDALNKPEHVKPEFPSSDWWKALRKRFSPRRIWSGERNTRLEPGFVVHLDAPWGGGKSSFASFLSNILNPARIASEAPEWLQKLNLAVNMPEGYQQQWHIVQFNAWQHQHISPPWWVFYETIRSQCSRSLFASGNANSYAGNSSDNAKFNWFFRILNKIDAGRLWLLEYLWRLWSPSTRLGVIVSLTVGLVVYYLTSSGKIGFDLAKLKLTGGAGDGGVFWSTLVMLLMGAAAPLVTIIKAFTSTLLPGTPAAAKNYSLGSGDPLERFRRHFARLMERYRRPILVVVDDLDRCSPEFVVDLVRGMQTILVSPRVVFLLLGDRDWIEKSFAEVHKTMQGIDVGPEHEFGARFVEKAIQLSFVLPDITPEEREAYVRRLLTPVVKEGDQKKESDDAAEKALAKLKKDLKTALKTDSFSKRKEAVGQVTNLARESDLLSVEVFEQFIDDSADELFLKEASDKSLLLEAASRIKGLSAILPANPRQIKRIINTLSLLMVIAERKFGRAGQTSDTAGWVDNDWQILARWVVLMVEWPKTWFTLSKYPELVDLVTGAEITEPARISADLSDAEVNNIVARIKACKQVMTILTFDDPDNGWDAGSITTEQIVDWLTILTPPTSGEMLDFGDTEA